MEDLGVLIRIRPLNEIEGIPHNIITRVTSQ